MGFIAALTLQRAFKLMITKETFLKMFSTTTKVFLVALLAISFFVISTEAKAAPEAAPEARPDQYKKCVACDHWTGLCKTCCDSSGCVKCDDGICRTCCEWRQNGK